MNELNPLEKAVYDLIPRGIENCRKYKDLHSHIDERSFKRIIRALRLKGKVIGAIRGKQGGYFVATNEEERAIATRQFEAQVKDEMAIVSAMKKAELEEIA